MDGGGGRITDSFAQIRGGKWMPDASKGGGGIDSDQVRCNPWETMADLTTLRDWSIYDAFALCIEP